MKVLVIGGCADGEVIHDESPKKYLELTSWKMTKEDFLHGNAQVDHYILETCLDRGEFYYFYLERSLTRGDLMTNLISGYRNAEHLFR